MRLAITIYDLGHENYAIQNEPYIMRLRNAVSMPHAARAHPAAGRNANTTSLPRPVENLSLRGAPFDSTYTLAWRHSIASWSTATQLFFARPSHQPPTIA